MKTSSFLQSIAGAALCSLTTPLYAQPIDGGANGASSAQPEAPSARTATPTAPSTTSQPSTRSGPTSAAQVVDREFASYDIDKSGQLDASEFSSWVAKLRRPSADGSPAQDSQQWSASLFSRADTDRDQRISKAEMAALLGDAQG